MWNSKCKFPFEYAWKVQSWSNLPKVADMQIPTPWWWPSPLKNIRPPSSSTRCTGAAPGQNWHKGSAPTQRTQPSPPHRGQTPIPCRTLFLHRFRLHLPVSARSGRCRRAPEAASDHHAACAQSGVGRAKGGTLERAAARICREGRVRVTTNTRLADLDIRNLSRIDDRRIEVIANGLPAGGTN